MKKKGTAWLALAVMGLLLVALVPHAALANHETNTTDDDETDDDTDDEDSRTGSDSDDTTQGESGDYYNRLSSRDNGTQEDESTSTATRTTSRTTTSRTTTSTRTSSLDDDEDGLTSGDEDMGTTGSVTMAGSSPDAVAPIEHEGVATFFVILLADNEVRPATDREMDVMVDLLESGEPLLDDPVGDMEESATRPVPESVMERTSGDGTMSGTSARTTVRGESIDNEEDDLGTGTQDDDMSGTSGADDDGMGSGTSGRLVS